MKYVTVVWNCAFSIRDLYSRCLMYIFLVTFTMPFTRHNAYGLEYGHKIWMQSTNLGAPEGWLDRKVPCPGQKIILPENEVVYFPSTLSIGPEIQLPHNGMILLPSRGKNYIKYIA